MNDEFRSIINNLGPLEQDDKAMAQELADQYAQRLDNTYTAEQILSDLEMVNLVGKDPLLSPTVLHQSMLPVSILDGLRTTEPFKYLIQRDILPDEPPITDEELERFIVQVYYSLILMSKDHAGQHQVAALLQALARMFASDPVLHELVEAFDLLRTAHSEIREHNERIQPNKPNPNSQEGE